MIQKKKEQQKAGDVLAVGLAFLAGLYILGKILTPKKEVYTYYCPNCRHIVSEKAPYCWYCRLPLDWQSSPIKAPLKRTVTLVFLGILVLLIIVRYLVYPFTDVSDETCAACGNAIWFFGGLFVRDFGGHFAQTVD